MVFQTDRLRTASANHITRVSENECEPQKQPSRAAKVITLQVDYEFPLTRVTLTQSLEHANPNREHSKTEIITHRKTN